MSFTDFHVHTKYSDGKHSLEETVLKAIEKGIRALGISDHSALDFDKQYCMAEENIPVYKAEIAALREKYSDKIEIHCGIEQDSFSRMPTDDYEYVIGSVHYLKIGEEYLPVDETPELLTAAVDKYFDGDIYSYIEAYYRDVSEVIAVTGADIIGHFDLITKFNENGEMFDTKHPRYLAAWKVAADKLLETGKIFEVNTGAISRGYRVTPYPSAEIMDYLHERGARFILSSDSHSANGLCCEFEKLRECFGDKYRIVTKPEFRF